TTRKDKECSVLTEDGTRRKTNHRVQKCLKRARAQPRICKSSSGVSYHNRQCLWKRHEQADNESHRFFKTSFCNRTTWWWSSRPQSSVQHDMQHRQAVRERRLRSAGRNDRLARPQIL